MKKFKFRLQRVLDAKQSVEDQRKRELGVAQQVLAAEEKTLAQLHAELEEVRKAERKLMQGGVKAGELMVQHRWKRELGVKLESQAKKVRKASEEIEVARERLVEASKDKKVLEKLKEKRLEEHNKEVQNQQQNLLDDIGARRNGRGSSDTSDQV